MTPDEQHEAAHRISMRTTVTYREAYMLLEELDHDEARAWEAARLGIDSGTIAHLKSVTMNHKNR